MNNLFNISSKNIALLALAFVAIAFFVTSFNVWVLIFWGVASVILSMILASGTNLTNPETFEDSPGVHVGLSLIVGPMTWVLLTIMTYKLITQRKNF